MNATSIVKQRQAPLIARYRAQPAAAMITKWARTVLDPSDDPFGEGAMGFHWVNGDLVDDAVLDPAEPEVLVYAPRPNGKLRLVALEYVDFADMWEAEHGDAVPTLFGEELTLHSTALGNNPYQIPDFWEIHAWVWRHNPAGMHAAFNPKASCEGRARLTSTHLRWTRRGSER